MHAIREVKVIDSQEVVVKLPKDFLEKRVEIIILPFEEFTTPPVEEPAVIEFERELEELSWEMGKRLYTRREELHER